MHLAECILIVELRREEHRLVIHTITDVLHTRMLVIAFLLQAYDFILTIDVCPSWDIHRIIIVERGIIRGGVIDCKLCLEGQALE